MIEFKDSMIESRESALREKDNITQTSHIKNGIRTLKNQYSHYRSKVVEITYSGYIAIEEAVRTKFFEKNEGVVNSHGSMITSYDTIDVACKENMN